MFRRTLLAAALAAPALVLLAAPASAGCTEEYADAMTTPRVYVFVGPNTADWVVVDPATLQVSVDGALIVSDATYLATIPVVIASAEARWAASSTKTYVNCV